MNWGWLSTVAGVIAGGALTILAAWLSDNRLNARERQRRYEERRSQRLQKRDEFQRETLLALQTASQKLIRNAGASLHQDILAFRKGGNWQRQPLPADLSDGHLQILTDAILLTSRIRDDDVRALSDGLREETTAIGFSRNESEAENRMMAAAKTQKLLIERTGKLVRELDNDD